MEQIIRPYCRVRIVIFLLMLICAVETNAMAQDVYTDGGGVVSLEAENGSSIARNGEQWVPSTASWGYSGSGFLMPATSTGRYYVTSYVGVAPELQFKVDFQTTGTYYVWLRGAGSAAHVGVDGAAVATASGIAGFTTGWTWSNSRLDGGRATITVSSPGVHTVNVWMWSDALWLDKILLANSSGYVPSGTGPAGNTLEMSGAGGGSGNEGSVTLVKFTSTAYDPYILWPSSSLRQFQLQHLARMVVFSPAFDSATSWYPSGLIYADALAVYVGGTTFGEAIQYTHPDWILKDQWGNNLYINFACYGGTCSQYAGDFSSPGFRSWWVAKVRALLSAGNYKGIYIDDVDMDFRTSDNWGNFVAPWDHNTNAVMTQENWRRYMAEFMEFIRQNLPGYEICHNSIWFAGGDNGRDADPYIHRQLMAADDINIEHGINDYGLTGGTGVWSTEAVLAFAERCHAMGKHVIMAGIGDGDPNNRTAYEYGVAGYLLINNGQDYSGDSFNMVIDPNYWWSGFDVNLGSSTGSRYSWNGLQRRDFTGGMVLLNYPGNAAISVWLPGSFTRLDGSVISSVTLQPRQALILRR